MADDNVVELGVSTTQPIPPSKVLHGAINEDLAEVVVVGFRKNGDFFFAASESYVPDIGFALDLGKASLIQNQLIKQG